MKMGIRCKNCSRQYDDIGALESHECTGDNVTILVFNPNTDKGQGENPARVFESRKEAEEVRLELDVRARIVDAPLIED
jgi:hypothetical protein